MNFRPKVSIVIPVYNGSNYLKEAVDSALAQTYGNVEVVVVNDGSNDNGKTEAIAKFYGGRIRYFSKENGGVATALNAAVEKSTGEYISWLSHDDVYLPRKVEAQIDFLGSLKEDKAKCVLYGDYEFIDKDSKHMNTVRISDIPPDQFVYALILSHPIGGCTTLIPKSCFDAVGMFDERLRTTQDYDMWFRMALHGYRFIRVPEALVQSRVHPEQGCVAMSDTHTAEVEAYYDRCLSKVLSLDKKKFPLPSASLSVFYIEAATTLKLRGQSRAAKKAFYYSRRCLAGDDMVTIFRVIKKTVGYFLAGTRQDFGSNPFIRIEYKEAQK